MGLVLFAFLKVLFFIYLGIQIWGIVFAFKTSDKKICPKKTTLHFFLFGLPFAAIIYIAKASKNKNENLKKQKVVNQ